MLKVELWQKVQSERNLRAWRLFKIDELPVDAAPLGVRLPNARLQELAQLYFADKLQRSWAELEEAGFEVSITETSG